MPINFTNPSNWHNLLGFDHALADNRSMTIYRVRVGFHNPSALTFRQLDEIFAPQDIVRCVKRGGAFRYFMDYHYESDERDVCSVCELAYSHACKVKKCPLVLVEELARGQESH